MFIAKILQQALTVTIFVMVMMIVIEYLTIRFKNIETKKLKNPFYQIIFGVFMGLIPGCLGSYAVVSMYIHGTISLAALTATFVATSGDEAFIMFSIIPETALKLVVAISFIAFVTGVVTHFLTKGKMYKGKSASHKFIHKEEKACLAHDFKKLPGQIKNITLQRLIIIITGTGFIFILFYFGGSHEHFVSLAENGKKTTGGHSGFGWEQITFLAVTLTGLFIAFTVTDHFLKKHLWNHVIKKHFLRLLIWTFATFFVLHFLNEYINLKDLVKGNIYWVLLISALIGLIPESGPHIIFISMFAAGIIPFPVLLANSVVQDGHGSIPLLAESGKSFITVKIINFIAGLFFGFILLILS